jgi:hypothetical protein
LECHFLDFLDLPSDLLDLDDFCFSAGASIDVFLELLLDSFSYSSCTGFLTSFFYFDTLLGPAASTIA